MKPEWITEEDLEWQASVLTAVEEFRVSVEGAMQRLEEGNVTESYHLYRNALNRLLQETSMSVEEINKFAQTKMG